MNWQTWHSLVSDQTCSISLRMDWSLWSTFSSFVFHTFTTQVTTDNVVIRVTRLSIIDWNSFVSFHHTSSKTQTLLTRPWGFEIIFVWELVFFRIQTFVTMSWMCWLGWEKIHTWGFQRATPHRTHTTDHTTDTTCTPTHNTLHHTQHHTETEKETQEKEKKTKKRREEKENREEMLLLKNVSNQQNPQDE